MTDAQTALLLGAYLDGELSPGEVLDMERRLAADPLLREKAARLDRAASMARATLGAAPVPAGLETRVMRGLPAKQGRAEQGRGEQGRAKQGRGEQGRGDRRRRERRSGWRPLAAAAAIALFVGALAGAGGVYWILRAGAGPLRDAVLGAHLRALAAPQPFDVASSDRHVVKPWFNGRTPVAPSAPDLADQGFPLVGGRIDVIDARPVPTMVYRRSRHVISVTVTPGAAPPGAVGEMRREGSTLERWTAQDLTYWAVSDLDAKELRRFAAVFRERTAPAP